jgi:hypothetical protein
MCVRVVLIVIGDFDVSCLLLAYTLWLFNIAMEAMAHLWMVYLLGMVISHGDVK